MAEEDKSKTLEERAEIARMNALTQARGIITTIMYGIPYKERLDMFQKLNIWKMAEKCKCYIKNGVDDKGSVIEG